MPAKKITKLTTEQQARLVEFREEWRQIGLCCPNMKTFKNICAQGDVLIRAVAAIPTTAKLVPPCGAQVIVTHSETGHHHVMEADRVDMYCDAENPLLAWIKVNRPATLEHLRPHDTHEAIKFAPGNYEVRRQREYVPEGFRRVAD